MNDPLLQARGLTTSLGSDDRPIRVVDGLDLSIDRTETFALLGESGCGKSMTALSLMRLLPPSGRIVAGHVVIGDTDLLSLPENEMRRIRGGRLGMIFQEPMTSLNPVMRVGDQIAEAVRVHDDPGRSQRMRRVVELLTAVGIPDPGQRALEYPHQLSGGMKQRVMIAMALAGKPDLLIADEPTTALDVTIQAQVLRLLKDLQQRHGMAILLITHDLNVVAETADRVAVMYAGQIVELATCEELFRTPRHPYTVKLFESLPTEEKRMHRLSVIAGSVPPLDRTFDGCRFADRCDHATEHCRTEVPPWIEGENGGVRCHLYAGPERTRLSPSVGEPVSRGGRVERPVEPLLDVQDLKVHFPIRRGVLKRIKGWVRAVDGVSLAIPRGHTLALVGESGCGKTTVGKAILQLVSPTAGMVDFEGEDLVHLNSSAMRRRRSDLQIIFQDPVASMNPRMLIQDIVEEGMRAQGIGHRRERGRRVSELLGHVGLPADSGSRYPHEFSGGQRQRICVARALAVNPKLIICDEPTSALDVSVQAQILNLLEDLQQEMDLSYLFITHDISVVSYLAHEVAVMYLGRIVERGTVREVLDNPKHPYTRALLSAVPVADAERRRQVIRLDGDMPSPVNPPSGCHFHPRCPQATERCREAYPGATRLSETRVVNCFEVHEDQRP
jgi:peptide/nickel transport system ATP-binding protein